MPGTLLARWKKELSLPESWLVRAESSWSKLIGGATVERQKNRKASGLAAGDPGEMMMGAGREVV